MADPVYVDAVSGATGAASLPLVMPATAEVGHVAVIFRHANVSQFAMLVPSGWTEVRNLMVTSNYMSVLTKVLTASDLGSTVNLMMEDNTKNSAAMAVIANVDTTNPVVAVNAAMSTTDSGPNYTGPTVATGESSLVLEAFFERSSTPSTSGSITGANLVGEAFGTGTAASSVLLGNDGVQNAGTVGGDTAQWSLTNSVHGGAVIALRGGEATPPPTGLAVSIWNGTTEVAASLEGIWNGSVVTPATFDTVT